MFDVARLAADVLLARLQRQHVGRASVVVDRASHEPSGNAAHVLVGRGDETRRTDRRRRPRRRRSAPSPATICAPHDARRRERGERERLGDDGDQHVSVALIAAAAAAAGVSMLPKKFGDCTTTAAYRRSASSVVQRVESRSCRRRCTAARRRRRRDRRHRCAARRDSSGCTARETRIAARPVALIAMIAPSASAVAPS